MGKVIFIVTHDFEFVCRTCSRVLHFDEGEISDDVLVTMDALPKLRELFLCQGECPRRGQRGRPGPFRWKGEVVYEAEKKKTV